jgi:fatty acid desaturase
MSDEREQNQRAFVRLLASTFFAVALVAFMAVQLVAAGGAVMIPVLIFAVAGVWVTR